MTILKFTFPLLASASQSYVGCDFKCQYLKDECLTQKCQTLDQSCQNECMEDFGRCNEICKTNIDTCTQAKNQCGNGCSELNGAFRDWCYDKCTVTFQCCSLPSNRQKPKEEIAAGPPIELEPIDIFEANRAFTIAAMGSSFFNNFNANICGNKCNIESSLCRNGCMFDQPAPDVCVAKCDQVQHECAGKCTELETKCSSSRALCSKSCPSNGPYSNRCSNMCNSRYECCQMFKILTSEVDEVQKNTPKKKASKIDSANPPEDAIIAANKTEHHSNPEQKKGVEPEDSQPQPTKQEPEQQAQKEQPIEHQSVLKPKNPEEHGSAKQTDQHQKAQEVKQPEEQPVEEQTVQHPEEPKTEEQAKQPEEKVSEPAVQEPEQKATEPEQQPAEQHAEQPAEQKTDKQTKQAEEVPTQSAEQPNQNKGKNQRKVTEQGNIDAEGQGANAAKEPNAAKTPKIAEKTTAPKVFLAALDKTKAPKEEEKQKAEEKLQTTVKPAKAPKNEKPAKELESKDLLPQENAPKEIIM